jgi:flagella basal body P-ring formation protein FlgA
MNHLHLRRWLWEAAAFVVQRGYAFALLLFVGMAGLLALPPATSIPGVAHLPRFVSPSMVSAPVPNRTIAAGEVVRDTDLGSAQFVRDDLTGKVLLGDQLQYVVALQPLVAGQPISAADVEPLVMLPVALDPRKAGETIQADHAGFDWQAFGRSQLQEGLVLDLNELDNKLVTAPILARRPIARASIAAYVMLPVVRWAVPNGAALQADEVTSRPFAYDAVKADLNVLVVDEHELLEPIRTVDDRYLAPDTPIRRAALRP